MHSVVTRAKKHNSRLYKQEDDFDQSDNEMQTITDDDKQSELDFLEFMDSEEKDQQCRDVNDKSQEITEDADLRKHSDISNENFKDYWNTAFGYSRISMSSAANIRISHRNNFSLLLAARPIVLEDQIPNITRKESTCKKLKIKGPKQAREYWASDSRRRFLEKSRGKSAAEFREAWLEVEEKSKWDQLAAIDKKRYVEDRKKAGLHPIAKQHVGVSIQELQAFISAEWTSIKDKSKWESMAAEDTKRFEQEMQVYSEAKNPTEEPCSSPSSIIMIMPIASENSNIALYNLYQLFHSKPSPIKSRSTRKQSSILLSCRNRVKERHSSRLAQNSFKKEHYVQPNTLSPSIACVVAVVQQPTCHIQPALLTECYVDNRPLGGV
uniref:Uncharacterized protein n=1 Tax=Ditylenchus dipsaci TaxID=166011 RepID=A0A915DZX2_9BILA